MADDGRYEERTQLRELLAVRTTEVKLRLESITRLLDATVSADEDRYNAAEIREFLDVLTAFESTVQQHFRSLEDEATRKPIPSCH